MTHVLCVGIATLDHVFRVAAMPQSPEKHRASDLAVTGGGTAANAAVAAARLGARVSLYAVLGADPLGDEIVARLEREGVDCAGVRRARGGRSPLSAILVDEAGERLIISYADRSLRDDTDWLPRALPAGVEVVLGDTRWQRASAHFFRLARAAGKRAVLDGDHAPIEVDEVLTLPTHIAFSRQGLRDLTGVEDARAALAALGLHASMWRGVTDGENGVFYWHDGAVRHEPAFPVAAIDTLGAGDVWHGAFAVALAEGMDEPAAVRFACAAAAIKCTRFGGCRGTPLRAEVDALLVARAPQSPLEGEGRTAKPSGVGWQRGGDRMSTGSFVPPLLGLPRTRKSGGDGAATPPRRAARADPPPLGEGGGVTQ